MGSVEIAELDETSIAVSSSALRGLVTDVWDCFVVPDWFPVQVASLAGSGGWPRCRPAVILATDSFKLLVGSSDLSGETGRDRTRSQNQNHRVLKHPYSAPTRWANAIARVLCSDGVTQGGRSNLLTGQVAVVTGAAKGVGRLCAEELTSAGAAVALVGRTAAEIESAANVLRRGGATVVAVVADVRDSEASAAAIDTTRRELGAIDILVNNAGVLEPGRITDVKLDSWWNAFEVHVKSTMAWCQAVLPR